MIDLVSVIIPAFNGQSYIFECLESLIMQSYKKFEIVIIDDGSSDGTGEIINSYAQKFENIIIIHKLNGGVASARNYGMEIANGSHIMFVDADDVILSNTYVEMMMKSSDKDFVVSGFTNRRIDENGVYHDDKLALKSSNGNMVEQFPEKFFISGYFHSVCGKLYKHKLIIDNDVHFPNVRLSEDSLFNLQYFKILQSWIILELVDYCYIHHFNAGNATKKYVGSDIEAYLLLHNELRLLNLKHNISDRAIYAQFLAICLRCIRNKDYTNSERTKQLRRILGKPAVRRVLLLTKTNLGDKITGIIVSSGYPFLYDIWEKVCRSLHK